MGNLMVSKHGFLTTKERSSLMKQIKGSSTKPEIKLRKALWHLGYRYRTNVSKLPGKPDIVIRKHNLVIFVDGEFWHGYNWQEKKTRIKSNRDYWIPKIEKNMARDKKNTEILKSQGWHVIRFWEKEVNKNIELCIEKVIKDTSE